MRKLSQGIHKKEISNEETIKKEDEENKGIHKV